MVEIDCDNCERVINEEETHSIKTIHGVLMLCSSCADVYYDEVERDELGKN